MERSSYRQLERSRRTIYLFTFVVTTNGFYTGHLNIHFLRSSDPIMESAFWVFIYEILLYLKETWHGASFLISMNRCSSLACHHFQKYSPSG